MPIRQGGILASRASTWPRDHFCRSTMAPRAEKAEIERDIEVMTISLADAYGVPQPLDE
jgi:hypothetical protein